MPRLAELEVGAPTGHQRRKGVRAVEFKNTRTRQAITVESAEPLTGYDLDAYPWPEGTKNPDALLVGEVDGEPLACFLEMKGRLDVQKAPVQLESAARHFHPTGRGTAHATQGARHHDDWARGADPLTVTLPANHRVVGLAVAFRQVPRPPPTPSVTVGQHTMPIRFVQLSNVANEARVDFRELLRKARVG